MKLDYSIELNTIYNKIGRDYCWVHTRGGIIPGNPATVVATTQKWAMGKSDIFSNLHHFRTDDMGKTWTGPVMNDNLGGVDAGNNNMMYICDHTPAYHRATGKLLSTGHTVTYDGGDHPASALDQTLPIYPSYTVYDEELDKWSDWKVIKDTGIENTTRISAGCSQRFDLEDGSILLPVAYLEKGTRFTKITVLKCSFDGEEIKVTEHGNSLAVDSDRGLAEASITRYNGKFYMTIRHDRNGYVCSSDDGLEFDGLQTWKWDTGVEVETYNTQSHWVTHSDGLFLTYTRNAGNNSHVFRHRAPLFIAEVDPVSIRIKRHTERILIPERGARLGNFNTVNINERETWVFNTEVLSPPECVGYGCDGSIYVAKIRWNMPNGHDDIYL